VSDPSYEARKEVARAQRAFYDAIEALDYERMAALWLDDERVQCIHPGWELLVGRVKVLESWRAIFENTGSIAFELSDLSIEVIGELAHASCIERICSRAGEQEVEGTAVATNLFLRSADGWKMLVHHASPILRATGE